ncbi:prepilin peptidase [Candidatus Saccharibacteria bacterium]|nr:prepilin peptidase [Candidatus Saccharibacteria bacterium]
MSMYYCIAGLLGLVFGSFAGATVWRLRARQLVQDKKDGEPVDAKELKRLRPLQAVPLSRDRSRCLECSHELAWFDLIPLVSWLHTGGKCRYCHAPIGWFEPAMELGTAALFISFLYYYLHLPTPIWHLLAVWVGVLVCLAILFAYDMKWFILPDVVVWPLVALSSIIAIHRVVTSSMPVASAWLTAGSVLVLAGLYLAIWLLSKGRWVGFGDVKLGLALGLLLDDWMLAIVALFFANFIGTMIVLPGLLTGRLSRTTHIPFGPLLIAGFLVALFFGQGIMTFLTGYSSTLLMLY